MRRIVIGCDEAAYEFKETIKQYLLARNFEVTDVGVYDTQPSLYPKEAKKVADAILNGEADRGILMCGTGIGMAITANKVKGIRAAVAHDHFSMERSVLSNDCQVICFGARIISPIFAETMLDKWFDLEFTNENSQKKLDVIKEIEIDRR